MQILLWAPRFFGKNENLLGIQTKRRLAAVSSSSPCEGSHKHDGIHFFNGTPLRICDSVRQQASTRRAIMESVATCLL